METKIRVVSFFFIPQFFNTISQFFEFELTQDGSRNKKNSTD
jgi:hypothetical protein